MSSSFSDNPAGGGDEAVGHGGGSADGDGDLATTADGNGAGGQNLGAESRSSKRKAGLMSKSSTSPVANGEYLEVAYEDSYSIIKEIEDLRSQLDEDVKEFGYCEQNEKLRDELVLKTKEMQCLRKQNEELQAKNDGLVKQNEKLQAKNDVVVKQNGELQAKNDGLVKQNEDLQATNDGVVKQNEELQSKNDCLVKQNEELQTKNDIMREQNGELQAKNGSLSYRNGDMRVKNDDLMKQNEDLQAKNDGLVKENEDLQAKNNVLVKQNEKLHTKNDMLREQNGELQAKNGGLSLENEELRGKNDDITRQNGQLQAQNDSLTNRIEEQNDGLMKLTEAIGRLNDEVTKLMDARKLLEEIDAGMEEVAAYAAELKGTNKDLSGDIVKEKRNLGAESGSRKRKAAAVSKSLTSSAGNGDQETEMAQETLKDESCFCVDLLPLAFYKYFETNKELIEARRELLSVLERAFIRKAAIGIKQMGELDFNLFENACKRKYGKDDYQNRASELVSNWQEELSKPSWHPFKMVEVNGEMKEILDDDDAKLKFLWLEYGDDVCNAVKTALLEIN